MRKVCVTRGKLAPGSSLLKRNCFQENTSLTTVWTIPVASQRTHKPAADPTEGSLSGKIDIVNNDTMVGRLTLSNVKAPNGVRTVSCTDLVRNRRSRWPCLVYSQSSSKWDLYRQCKSREPKKLNRFLQCPSLLGSEQWTNDGCGWNNDDSSHWKENQDTSISWFDYCKIRKDGDSTITAKNLQGFDGCYKGSEDSILVSC